MEWRPIKDADHAVGKEIIGVKLINELVGNAHIRVTAFSDPFISFWSPTLNKYYKEPTHFIYYPSFPKELE